MEVIHQFVNQYKTQLIEIYNKETENVDEPYILLINYTKSDDIKVSCSPINTINPQILVDLENIKEKSKNTDNSNYALIMNDEKVNIIKFQE